VYGCAIFHSYAWVSSSYAASHYNFISWLNFNPPFFPHSFLVLLLHLSLPLLSVAPLSSDWCLCQCAAYFITLILPCLRWALHWGDWRTRNVSVVVGGMVPYWANKITQITSQKLSPVSAPVRVDGETGLHRDHSRKLVETNIRIDFWGQSITMQYGRNICCVSIHVLP